MHKSVSYKLVMIMLIATTVTNADVVFDRNGNPVANGHVSEKDSALYWKSCNGQKEVTYSKQDGYTVQYGDTCREPNTNRLPEENSPNDKAPENKTPPQ
jgi:hypothetical protein